MQRPRDYGNCASCIRNKPHFLIAWLLSARLADYVLAMCVHVCTFVCHASAHACSCSRSSRTLYSIGLNSCVTLLWCARGICYNIHIVFFQLSTIAVRLLQYLERFRKEHIQMTKVNVPRFIIQCCVGTVHVY